MPLVRSTYIILWCIPALMPLQYFAAPAIAGNHLEEQVKYPSLVPDTGQVLCYDTVEVIPCPNPGEPFYGQDANYSINTPKYSGNNQANLATITDLITRLTWQRTPDTQPKTWRDAIDYTSALTLSDFTDWRMPSKKELQTIFVYNSTPGPLQQAALPTKTSEAPKERNCVWTKTNVNFPSLETKTICLPDKQGALSGKYKKRYAYAVRGPFFSTGHFKNNGNQTVTDKDTGLMWQSTEILPRKWENALAYCEKLQLGGFDDWRLPTIKELITLRNEKNTSPSIDTNYFPATRSAAYWTSTTFSGHPGFAWYVRFDNGMEYNGGYKGRRYFVRAVRSITLATAAQRVAPKPRPIVQDKITPVVLERVPAENPVKVAPPNAEDMDIFEPYPLDYRLYEE